MAEIQELVLTFLERISHNALPKNRKRETLDACIIDDGNFRSADSPASLSNFHSTKFTNGAHAM